MQLWHIDKYSNFQLQKHGDLLPKVVNAVISSIFNLPFLNFTQTDDNDSYKNALCFHILTMTHKLLKILTSKKQY